MKRAQPADPPGTEKKATNTHHVVIEGGRHFVQPGHAEIPNLISVSDCPDLGRLRPVAQAPLERIVHCLYCGYENQVRGRREHTPIPERFDPYYRRALDDDLDALVEYYKQITSLLDPGSAFYQCLGYLATTGYPEHTKIVRAIMRINDTGGAMRKTPAKRAIYDRLYGTLGNTAREQKKWIRKKRARLRQGGWLWTRDGLWHAYAKEKLPGLLNADLAHQEELEKLFMMVAQTKPNLGPAQAARKLACEIVGLSEGLVSHKTRRKK